MKKKLLFFLIISIVLLSMLIIAMLNAQEAEIATVTKGEIQEYIELSGKVELDKIDKVFSEISGIVKNARYEEGDSVNSGDLVAELDSEDLNFSLAQAQESYIEAKANIQQMLTTLEVTKNQYEYKKDLLEKYKALYDKGTYSQQELNSIMIDVANVEGDMKNTEQQVKASEAKAETSRLQMEEIQSKIKKLLLYANSKGNVISKNVENGTAVEPGTLVYEIGDCDLAYVKVDVLTDDINKVKIGQKAILHGGVLKDKELEGTVYYIAPKAVSVVSSLGVEKQRIEVRIKFDDKLFQFKQGYGIDVKIITDYKDNTFLVPDRAVFNSDNNDCVFIVNNYGKLELKIVKIGIKNKDQIEIIEGLTEGQKIVIDPNNNIKPGVRIKTFNK